MRSAGLHFLVFLISVSFSSTTFGQGVLVDDGGDPIEFERPESRIIGMPILEGGQWEAFISDPITVTFDVDFGALATGVAATATPVSLIAPYDTVRNALVLDAAAETDDLIALALPTAAQATFDVPANLTLSGNLEATKANLKALGFPGLDAAFGVSDGQITFSTAVPFDFDNSDGVSPGTIDFEAAAAHEIGHLLGFASVVDEVDLLLENGVTDAVITPTPFDLYRFEDGSANDPLTFADFTTELINRPNDRRQLQ